MIKAGGEVYMKHRVEKCSLCRDLLERFFSSVHCPECLETGSGSSNDGLRAASCFFKALIFFHCLTVRKIAKEE